MNTSRSSTSDDEKKDSSELTYLEARPFLVDVKDEQDEKEESARETSSPPTPPPPHNQGLSKRFWIAAAVNSISTVGIVFVNKQIFTNPSLAHSQVTFAAFHFTLTYLFLYLTSRPNSSIQLFTAKLYPPLTILPLALAVIGNVVLMNASLAYSSIQFYQIVRVLLTPCVAGLNLVLYNLTIPVKAAAMLVPVCIGVGVVSWFDAMGKGEEKETSGLGMVFAFSALCASAVHTVWIGRYHRVLGCSSMQLLMNQAPVSVGVMLFIIPFSDDVTAFKTTGLGDWGLIFISGGLACLINLSQFLIISEAGPVSSTVVGSFKTCSIIAMGWIVSGKQLKDGSLLGVVLAVGGIISYSYVMQREARK